MTSAFLINQFLGVLATASISALVAIGLAISFRLMGVINLAHGQFIMLGAYAVVVSLQHGLPFPVAVLVALVAGFLFGALTEVALIRRFYDSPELAILATFALGILIQQVVQIIFGNSYQNLANPLPGTVSIAGTAFPGYRLVLIVITIVVLGAIIYLLSATPIGMRIRAVSTDSSLADSLGIRSSLLKTLVFALSTALATLAGALVAPTTNVEPAMGSNFLFIAFVVVIIGGNRVSMVLVAALLAAAVENTLTYYVAPLVSELAVLALAFLVLASARTGSKGATI
jgi:branched-subunit amino acid ABC-type transport system permease component